MNEPHDQYDIEAVFGKISRLAATENIPLVLVGAWALNTYGVSRQTLDIDFMTTEQSLQRVTDVLSPFGYREVVRTPLFVKFRAEAGYLLDVDLLFASTETLKTVLSDGELVDIGGAGFVVPSLSHLIGMKLHALRYNRAMRLEKDMGDILDLLEVNEVGWDSEDFRSLCQHYGTDALYQEICTRLKERQEDG